MKKKYYVVDGRTLDTDINNGTVKSPITNEDTNMNIFDDDIWTGEHCPYFIFDCDTGAVVDWAPTPDAASVAIEDDEMWNGIEIQQRDIKSLKNLNDAYEYAMSGI